MERIAIGPQLIDDVEHQPMRLIGGVCSSCQRFHFPSQDTCPYCGAAGCGRVPLSREGTVYLCTTVINRPPGYDGAMPYGFGIVELPEGLRIISRIIDPQNVSPGAAVHLVLEPVGADDQGRALVTYAFELIGNEQRATSDERRTTSHS